MNKNELLIILEKRFNENIDLHPNHKWSDVLNRINDNNIKVKRNLKKSKAVINEIEIKFNLDKVYLRKDNRKEIKINRKKLKQALNFKSKQIRRKKK